MSGMNPVSPVSKAALWTGRVMSALPVLMLLMSGVMKLMKPKAVVDGFVQLGFSTGLITGIGILEIACTVIYIVPRTSVLGAILLTGYLGGAVCTTLRAGDPNFYMPAILGVLLWGGLYLRDARIRALIPLTR
jgi:DoxX-like protein